MRDLGDADVGVGKQRPRNIKVVFRQLWWTAAADSAQGHPAQG